MHKINFTEETKKASRENAKEVINKVRINDQDIMYKIAVYCDTYGFDPEEVKQRILSNDLIVAAYFAVNPTKQNIAEKLQAEYIMSIPGVKNFKKLPTALSKGLFMYDGNIVENHINLPTESKDLKTIDFYWEYNGYKIYAGCKYTNHNGGAQDNQYADLTAQLKEAKNIRDKNIIFLAICDGDYYQRKDRVEKDLTPEQVMNTYYKTANSRAITTDELEEFLNTLCK